MPAHDVFAVVRNWIDGSEPAHTPSKRISSYYGLMPPFETDLSTPYWLFWKAEGKEFPDGVYYPKKGQRIKAVYIYYEPEDGGEECVRQRLDGTSSAAMTATVLIAAAYGTLRALELWIEGAEWKRPDGHQWIEASGEETPNPEVPGLNDLGFIMGWRGENLCFL